LSSQKVKNKNKKTKKQKYLSNITNGILSNLYKPKRILFYDNYMNQEVTSVVRIPRDSLM
jgi:hypothetical protein